MAQTAGEMVAGGGGDIIVVPFHTQGHIFPATELCRRLAGRNYPTTLLLPSGSSSPPSLNPLIRITHYPAPHQPPDPSIPDNGSPFRDLLSQRFHDASPPLCAVVDVLMSHQLLPICRELGIPAVSFFTAGACSTALVLAASKLDPADLAPGLSLALPGLPEDMPLTLTDIAAHSPPPPAGFADTAAAAALLFNTCDGLERPFLDYVAKEAGKPVWGVGPLLPAELLSTAGSLVQDEDARRADSQSSITYPEVQKWLDSKPRGSVIYISFGSLLSPSDAELAELASALEESDRPFIWSIQPGAFRLNAAWQPTSGPGFDPVELARAAGEEGRGLVIKGWAPQLLILSHPSTAGFLTHCGWNSTVEAMGCGVPILAWPIHGDQVQNAKLVTRRLKIGHAISNEGGAVTRDAVLQGIERVMGDEETRERANSARSFFSVDSSSDSMEAFLQFIIQTS